MKSTSLQLEDLEFGLKLVPFVRIYESDKEEREKRHRITSTSSGCSSNSTSKINYSGERDKSGGRGKMVFFVHTVCPLFVPLNELITSRSQTDGPKKS